MSKRLIPSSALLSFVSRTAGPCHRELAHRSGAQLTSAPSCLRASSGTTWSMTAGNNGGSSRRAFSGSRDLQAYKTVQEQRSRYRSGPFSWKAGLLFLSTGGGLVFYFRYEKARMERKRIAEATKGVGKPRVGGSFTLLDHNGVPFSSDTDLKGRYSLVYFGFSHCPDICPEELDKMARIIDLVRGEGSGGVGENNNVGGMAGKLGKEMVPLFITCDPARDTPAVLKEYLGEFHPAIVGLTGTWEEIKDVCKKYRVYFSTPEGVQKGQDYLVDHSIYFYLMDPEGDFVEAIGRQHSPEAAAAVIKGHVGDWRGR